MLRSQECDGKREVGKKEEREEYEGRKEEA